jgi:hypothetical protein
MKRLFTIALLCSIIFTALQAYEYIKVDHYQIGPGTYYTSYKETTRPWALYVVEADITNPYITLESNKAGDRLFSRDTPSSMSTKNSYAGHRVVSAINGDYYHTGGDYLNAPVSPQVLNGEFVWGFNSVRSAFSFNEDKKPHIINAQFTGAVSAKDSNGVWVNYPLSAVNRARGENQLILYNRYLSNSTGTNGYGFESVVTPLDDWVVNDTVRCVVESREKHIGNMGIPDGKVVLSGHGTGVTFMDHNFQIGDTVRVVQGLANNLPRLTQLVGGGPRMLQDGVDVVDASYPNESIGETHCTYRHPRTAIGFNQDSTKVYFVVVDGRQEGFSVGMSLYELAAFMKEIGAAHAVNLDGGGSSSIVVWNTVKNSPSDGGERSVSNSIFCVSTAPAGDELAHIQFIRDSIAVYKNNTISTGISGWDEYYHPRNINEWDELQLEYNEDLGEFYQGDFTASHVHGNTDLKVTYGSESDSVLIHVIRLDDLEIYPKAVTTDLDKMIKFTVSATDESGVNKSFKNEIFNLEVTDPEVGSINERGEFNALKEGETAVVVHYGLDTDTAWVSVEIGEGEAVLDPVESLDDYTVSADQYIVMDSTSVALIDRAAGDGSKAVEVNYHRSSDREDGNIYLECDPVTIYGLPSEILIDALGDSIGHWIYILLEDAEGKEYSAKTSSSLLFNDEFRSLECPMDYLLPFDRNEVYPMTYKGVRLRINKSATTGTVYFDNIKVSYPPTTSIERDNTQVPATFRLEQNYPNPFNPETRIHYHLNQAENVELDIFDIRGKYVQTLVSEYQSAGTYRVRFNAEHLPAGIYYYRLTAGSQMETKKMVLIK